MKLPNKVLNYNESVISKFPLVLSLLKQSSFTVFALYERIKLHIEGVDEYLEILDCLFAMNKIKLDETKRSLSLC